MYLAIRVDAIEAFSCLSYRTKKLRIWVVFFSLKKFLDIFFEIFHSAFWLAENKTVVFAIFTTESDSLWNFRSRFIIWNSKIMRENMFFWALKIEKNVYFEKKSVSLRYSRKTSEVFLISCSWVIWTEQNGKRHGKELFLFLKIGYFNFWT